MSVYLETPLASEEIRHLRAGDKVYLSGTVYTGRDAAHKRMVELLDRGKPMPFAFSRQVIYYAGPAPAKPGQIIGAIGPTTSGRMDKYTPRLMAHGLTAMIGKGLRSPEVKESIIRYGGIYFAAVGGAAALIRKCVTASRVIAFEELGTEAIRALTVENFPLIVAIDAAGGDIYSGQV